MCSADASTSREISAPGRGCISRTQSAKAALAVANTACIASVQGMLAAGLGPPFSWSVSSLRMWAVAGMKRW
jgi:hypothetical protein